MPLFVFLFEAHDSLVVDFYGLVSRSDPGLRISLPPGLLHHCSERMNSGLTECLQNTHKEMLSYTLRIRFRHSLKIPHLYLLAVTAACPL